MLYIIGQLSKKKESTFKKNNVDVPKLELEFIALGSTETIYVHKDLHKSVKENLSEGKNYKLPIKYFVNKGVSKDGQPYGFVNFSLDDREEIEEL